MPDLEAMENARKQVEEDVRAGIGRVGFDQSDAPTVSWGPPFEKEDDRRRDDVIAVPWSITCPHVGDLGQLDADEAGIFKGLFPTGRNVTIRGVTFVDMQNPDDPTLSRYVDWADVLTQLGCTVSQRVIVGEEAYVKGLEGINNPPAES